MLLWAEWAWQGARNYRAANYIDSGAKKNEMNLNANKNEMK